MATAETKFTFVSHKHRRVEAGLGVLGVKWKKLEAIADEWIWLDVACMLQKDTPDYNYERMTKPTVLRLHLIMQEAAAAVVLLEDEDASSAWIERNLPAAVSLSAEIPMCEASDTPNPKESMNFNRAKQKLEQFEKEVEQMCLAANPFGNEYYSRLWCYIERKSIGNRPMTVLGKGGQDPRELAAKIKELENSDAYSSMWYHIENRYNGSYYQAARHKYDNFVAKLIEAFTWGDARGKIGMDAQDTSGLESLANLMKTDGVFAGLTNISSWDGLKILPGADGEDSSGEDAGGGAGGGAGDDDTIFPADPVTQIANLQCFCDYDRMVVYEIECRLRGVEPKPAYVIGLQKALNSAPITGKTSVHMEPIGKSNKTSWAQGSVSCIDLLRSCFVSGGCAVTCASQEGYHQVLIQASEGGVGYGMLIHAMDDENPAKKNKTNQHMKGLVFEMLALAQLQEIADRQLAEEQRKFDKKQAKVLKRLESKEDPHGMRDPLREQHMREHLLRVWSGPAPQKQSRRVSVNYAAKRLTIMSAHSQSIGFGGLALQTALEIDVSECLLSGEQPDRDQKMLQRIEAKDQERSDKELEEERREEEQAKKDEGERDNHNEANRRESRQDKSAVNDDDDDDDDDDKDSLADQASISNSDDSNILEATNDADNDDQQQQQQQQEKKEKKKEEKSIERAKPRKAKHCVMC